MMLEQPVVVQQKRRLSPAMSVLATVFLVALSIYCFRLYTTSNHFPLDWHPDEPSKVQQLMTDTRNYLHPELLLEVTELVRRVAHVPADWQAVAITGRDVSAAFAVIAVLALALFAYLRFELLAMIAVGISVGLCPPLLTYAHYMKEDTGLIMGMALVVLAMELYQRAANRHAEIIAVAILGAMCGLSMSAKYVGVLFVIVAIIGMRARERAGQAPRLNGRQGAILFFSSILLPVVVVNWRVFLHPLLFCSRLAFETRHTLTKHQGLTMHQPNTWFIRTFFHEAMPVAWILAAIYCAWLFLRKEKNKFDWIIPGFTIGWVAMMSFDILPQNRYLLPAVIMAHVMAGLAAVEIPKLVLRNAVARSILTLGIVAIIAGFLLPRDRDFLNQFANDSRGKLREWIASNIPAGSVMVAEEYLGLVPQDTHELKLGDVKILIDKYGSDIGSLDVLAAEGVRYAIICDLSYERYFSPYQHPTIRGKSEYSERRRWYEQLFSQGRMIWNSQADHDMGAFTNPTVKIYELPHFSKEK